MDWNKHDSLPPKRLRGCRWQGLASGYFWLVWVGGWTKGVGGKSSVPGGEFYIKIVQRHLEKAVQKVTSNCQSCRRFRSVKAEIRHFRWSSPCFIEPVREAFVS